MTAALKIFLVPILLGLAAGQFFLSGINLADFTASANGLIVTRDNGIITVGDIYSPEAILRLTPFQDFVFVNNQRTSLKTAYAAVTTKTQQEEIRSWLFPDIWSWKLDDPPVNYTFRLSLAPRLLTLERTVSAASPNLTGLGQALYYCQACVVTPLPDRVRVTDGSTGRFADVLTLQSETVRVYPEARIVEIDRLTPEPVATITAVQQISF